MIEREKPLQPTIEYKGSSNSSAHGTKQALEQSL